MRTATLILMTALLVTACGGPTVYDAPPSSEEEMPSGCYVMEHKWEERVACFGCSDGKCREPDTEEWRFVDQNHVHEHGAECEETQFGCELR